MGVGMWVEPVHVPVNILEALSYGTGAGLRREVEMDQGPGTSFLLFYHVLARKSEKVKNSIFAPGLPPCMKIYLTVIRGWTIFYLIVFSLTYNL